MTVTRSDLESRFNHHPPKDEYVIQAHETIRKSLRDLADVLVSAVPEGRELSLALTHLEDAMMWANAGIARNQGRLRNRPQPPLSMA